MESLVIAIAAVWPFICYMMVGAVLKHTGIADDTFFRKLNQVAFISFFPLVVFKSIYNMDTSQALSPKFMIFVIVLFIVLLAALMLIVPRLVKDDRKKGVIIQAIFRGNTLLFALPLATSVYGESAANQAGILVAFVVPFYNVASVLILSYFSAGHTSLGSLLKKVLTNPIILGTIAAFVMRAMPFRLPDTLMAPAYTMASMATPAAVIVLGGTLELASVKASMKYLVPSLGVRFFLIPIIMLLLSFPMGFTGFERFLAMVLFMTPTAAASFPMAVSMGADGDLAGEFVAVSTIASIGVIFVWILFLHSFGLM